MSTEPAGPAVSAASRTVSRTLVAVLALLTAVAPLATDMYLPAFPAMAGDLTAAPSAVQLTLTAFLVGLGLGQLFIGPISDAVGRRRPLLIGVAACLVASIACALAPDIGTLTVARFVQGLGGAAGIVLARAIIADVATGAVAARLLGVTMIINVVAPVIAPLSGGAIIAGSGWRTVFWVLAALTVLMGVGSALFVPESLPVSARTTGGIRATLHGARQALTNRNYVGYLLTFCFAFAGLFAYISASPFVVQNVLGLSATAFSLVFGANAVVIVVTSAVAAALAGRVGYRSMIAVGLVAAGLSSAGLLAAVLGSTPLVPTLVAFACFQGSLGLIFANATTLALAETGSNAGTGSAFLGFLQFTLAAVVSPLVGLWGEDTTVPAAVAMLVAIVLAALAFVVLPRAGSTSREDTAHAQAAVPGV